MHLAKLQNIKAAVKTVPPKSHAHLKSKPKKNQMLEGKSYFLLFNHFYNASFLWTERYTEIERENRILLEKMTNILQNPKGISNANPQISTMYAPPTATALMQ